MMHRHCKHKMGRNSTLNKHGGNIYQCIVCKHMFKYKNGHMSIITKSYVPCTP